MRARCSFHARQMIARCSLHARPYECSMTGRCACNARSIHSMLGWRLLGRCVLNARSKRVRPTVLAFDVCALRVRPPPLPVMFRAAFVHTTAPRAMRIWLAVLRAMHVECEPDTLSMLGFCLASWMMPVRSSQSSSELTSSAHGGQIPPETKEYFWHFWHG